jgi:hypothetical protein
MKFRVTFVSGLIAALGCSSQEPVPTVSVDPPQAAARALEVLDANSDGAIEPAECESVYGLHSVFASYDLNTDGKLTSDELEQGISTWSHRDGPIAVEIKVVSGRRAVSNAEVRLKPVPFLAEALPEAEGVTNAEGLTRLHAYNYPFPESLQRERFIFPGLYDVHVWLPGQRKEIAPVGAAFDNSAMASRALRIEVLPNGTAKVVQSP